MCVVINNSSYPAVKNNNTAYHAFGRHWMQARGFLNYRLKYCWPKFIYCICQPNELKREIKKKNWRGQTGGQPKVWRSHGPPRIPLRTATACLICRILLCACAHCVKSEISQVRNFAWLQSKQTRYSPDPDPVQFKSSPMIISGRHLARDKVNTANVPIQKT